MGVISWDKSGLGADAAGPMSLEELQELAISSGFSRDGMGKSERLAQLVDMKSFLAAFNVNCLSAFKKKFFDQKLSASGGKAVIHTQASAPTEVAVAKAHAPPLPLDQFEAVTGTWKDLKWRIIPKPGGATMKPDVWYLLNGLQLQLEKGDCTEEKPMWAATGGLDFNGREIWEGWTKYKGMTKDEAKAEFCQLYADALAEAELNFRKY